MDAAARLINAEIAQYGEGYFVTKRFAVTKNKDIRALRRGVADGRVAEGITIIPDGRLVEWHLYDQKLEYRFPIYGPHEAPIGESESQRIARKTKENARDYMTARVGGVKLESWVMTQEGKERMLEHWRKMHATDVVIEKLREWTQDEQDKYRMSMMLSKKKYDQEQIDAAMERMAA